LESINAYEISPLTETEIVQLEETLGRPVERALISYKFKSQLRPMKVEEIAEAVAKLPPDQLARFRRWFIAFEAGHSDHAEELDSTATKLGRLAGRAFAELKKRAKEPRE